MDDTLTYGTWVRRRRRDLDLTQSELARRVCCALTTIEKLEADARRPPKAMAERLADALLLAPDARPGFLTGARSGWMGEEIGVLAGPAPLERSALGGMLPVPLTPLIGRAREVAAVCAALATPAVRVLTLTGPGGIGKTRLALQVTAELELAFGDGVVFVDLAPIRDPALVLTTIAAALGLPDVGGQPLLARLQAALHERQLLLLLDNFEQVLPTAPLVAELLTTAPHVKVLLTSRVLVGVYGEHTVPVPPLTLPDLSDLPLLDRLGQVETVQLFVARAQAAKPDFCLTNANARAVSAICHQLDGLPLSIELAAARVRHLSPEALLQHVGAGMTGHLQVLTGGPRSVPARQQTVRATVAWSYDLLDGREQRLFQRLGVFVGGWTLEAAERVCGWEDAGQVHDALEALLDNSLLLQRASMEGEARFTMLETIREYAHETLIASGAADDVHTRHLDYYCRWAEQARAYDTGPKQWYWRRQFEAEHDNVRAALEWSAANRGTAEQSLRLAAACGPFWAGLGYLSEGRMCLAALSRPGTEQGTAAHAQALHHAARLAFLQSDYPASRVLCAEGLAVAQALGPIGRASAARALHSLGEIATEEGDYAAASTRFEAALTLWHDLGDHIGLGHTLLQYGWSLMRTGAYDQATSRMLESLVLFREAGNTGGIALNLSGLGEAAIRQGHDGRATLYWLPSSSAAKNSIR